MLPDKTADWQKPQNDALPEWFEAGTLSVPPETARIMKSSYDSPEKKKYIITEYSLSPLLSLPVNQDRLFRRPTWSQEEKGL